MAARRLTSRPAPVQAAAEERFLEASGLGLQTQAAPGCGSDGAAVLQGLPGLLLIHVVRDPRLGHRKGVFESLLCLGFLAGVGKGFAEFDLVGDVTGREFGSVPEMHQRLGACGRRESAVQNLGKLAQHPVQIHHLAMPHAEDVVGEIRDSLAGKSSTYRAESDGRDAVEAEYRIIE